MNDRVLRDYNLKKAEERLKKEFKEKEVDLYYKYTTIFDVCRFLEPCKIFT